MALFTVNADGQAYEFEAPEGATADQIRTLAARALKKAAPHKEYQRPVLEKRITEALAPKPQGELKATPWSLSNAISDKVTGALSAFGMDEGKARRFANKATGALTDLTPVGAATEADEARRAFSEGRYLPALGHGALAAFSAVPDGGAMAGKVAHSIIAPLWHGSPHQFEKFALEKVGTGEGAQAYGHGLYFAENRDVADMYREQVSGDGFVTGAGRVFNPYDELTHPNIRSPLMRTGDLDASIARAHELLPTATEQSRPMLEADLAKLQQVKAEGGLTKNPGHIYEVSLNADPPDFLDYDVPALHQKAAVRELLGVPETKAKWDDPRLGGIMRDALRQVSNPTPEEVSLIIDNDYGLYQRAHDYAKSTMPPEQYKIADALGQSVGYYLTDLSRPQFDLLSQQYAVGDDMLKLYRGREEELRKAGILGVRYLDEGSRSVGSGTRNYVVFDPSIIDVLGRY